MPLEISPPIDRHGSIDVTEDVTLPHAPKKAMVDTHDIRIRVKSNSNSDQEVKYQIHGISLNSFLRNVFILYGYKKDVDEDTVPGGLDCWEDIIEPMNACLSTLATVSEVLNRITYALVVKRKNNISYGCLSFLFHWIAGFSCFMPNSDIVQLKDRISHLESSYLGLSKSEYLSKQRGFKDDQRCRNMLSALKSLISSTVRERFMPPFSTVSDPRMELVVGQWTSGVTEERKVQLHQFKKSVEEAPQIKLEIFGGEMLLDSFNDDSDDDMDDEGFGTKEDMVIQSRPMERVPASFNLLQDPFTLHLLDSGIDLLEIARQWTLIDHSIFRSVALHALVSNPSAHTQSRSIAVLTNDGSLHHAMCRRMIDRFNATATWVMHTILIISSPEERANRVELFIKIASHFLYLRNFNGLMVIMTALQQGCIARLRKTFALVTSKTMQKYEELKSLMAGNKNFSRYREKMDLISGHLDAFSSHNDQAWRLCITAKTRLHYKEEDADVAIQKSLQALCDPAQPSPPIGPVEMAGEEEHLGIVPYMGVHLAEMTAIAEGNGDFLSNCPHLFNVEKYRLYCNTLMRIKCLQSLRYNFTPLRCMIAALNHAVKRHMKLSVSEHSDQSKQLYELSEMMEPDGDSSDDEVEPVKTKISTFFPSSSPAGNRSPLPQDTPSSVAVAGSSPTRPPLSSSTAAKPPLLSNYSKTTQAQRASSPFTPTLAPTPTPASALAPAPPFAPASSPVPAPDVSGGGSSASNAAKPERNKSTAFDRIRAMSQTNNVSAANTSVPNVHVPQEGEDSDDPYDHDDKSDNESPSNGSGKSVTKENDDNDDDFESSEYESSEYESSEYESSEESSEGNNKKSITISKKKTTMTGIIKSMFF